jgi:[protein-PII] uridylyltransferase
VKNGICGLRDCQRIFWVERVQGRCYGGEKQPSPIIAGQDEVLRQAYAFLLGVRCLLHMLGNRRIDILEVSMQPDVARIHGFPDAGALMEKYFKTVMSIKHCILSVIEQVSGGTGVWGYVRRAAGAFNVAPGIYLLDGILYPRQPCIPETKQTVMWMFEVFNAAIRCHATFSTSLCNMIRSRMPAFKGDDFRNQTVDRAFLALISLNHDVGRILLLMHETGFLQGIIPEFASLTCKVEYDAYHEYTVDTHILLAIQALDELLHDKDELVRTVYLGVPNRRLLRLGILLHDIGKALPGDHARSGAIIADNITARLGLSTEEQDRVRLLVYQHLALSNISFHREPEKAVIRTFAEMLGDKENCDMLYLLTVLDIRHVGSHAWTGWKAKQLSDIYHRTIRELEEITLPEKDSDRDEKEDASSRYWQEVLPEERERHRIWLEQPTIDDINLYTESFVGFCRLTVVSFDRRYFLSDFVACLVSEGLNVLSAQVYSPPGNKILDVFHVVQDGTTHVAFDERVVRIKEKWRKIQSGESKAETLIRNRLKTYSLKPQRKRIDMHVTVVADNSISPSSTVIEVSAPDCFGLLYTVVKTLSAHDVSIVSARIATRIDRAMDVFYITDNNNNKISDEDECQHLQKIVSGEVTSFLHEGDNFDHRG